MQVPRVTIFFFSQDYIQYHLNLGVANENREAKWIEEYRFTEAYNLHNISLSNMQTLANLIASDPSVMQTYALYNSVSYKDTYCDDDCQLNHNCAIRNLDSRKYEKCLASSSAVKSASYLSILMLYFVLQRVI